MCGGGSKNTTTSTSQTNIPPELLKMYQGLTGFGTGVAQTPLQQYGGSRVAGFTPDETNAFNLNEQNVGVGLPFINQASDWYGSAATPTYPLIPQYNRENLQPYMNPWSQDVIDTTLADMERSDTFDQNRLRDQGIMSGASPFFGDRAGVAAAELARGQEANRNRTVAGLRSQGFTNAQQQFAGQQQLMQSGLNSDANRYLSAAGGMSNLGQQAAGMGSQDVASLLRTGALQRDVAQQQLNIPYQNFQEQQQYPFKIADFLRGMVTGTGSNWGSSTSQSTTPPAPSAIGQIAGLGTAGLGLYQYLTQPQTQTTTSGGGGGGLGALSGIASLVGGIGHLFGLKEGGAVKGFASGGPPHVDAGSFTIPTADRYQPTAPAGGGLHTGQQTYINALPQLQAADMPPPTVTRLPAPLLAGLNKFPGFIDMGQQPATAPPASNAGLSAWTQWLNNLLQRNGKSNSPFPSGFAEGGAPDDTTTTPKGLGARRLPPGMALMDLGFGMMASPSPFAGQAIGQGAQSGLAAMQSQLASMDAGAQVLNDGKTYRVFYPATGESIDTGIPVQSDWTVQTNPSSLTPFLFQPKTGATKPLTVPGQDQYGNPLDPSSGSNSGTVPFDPSDPNAVLDVDGRPIDPGVASNGQKETGIGRNYDTLSPVGQNIARMMVAGQVAPVTGRTLNTVPPGAGAPWLKIIDAANEWAIKHGDPGGFNGNIWSARAAASKEWRAGGAQAPVTQVTSANKVLGHLGQLWEDTASLPNVDASALPEWMKPFAGPVTTSLNAAKQFLTSGGGSKESQAVARFIVDRQAVSDEVTKFFASGGAGGGENEISRHLASIDIHKSKPDIYASLQAIVILMNSQLHALESRFHTALGPNAVYPGEGGKIVNPASIATINKISNWTGDQAPDAPSTNPLNLPRGAQ